MTLSIPEKIKGFILNPVETFRMVAPEDPGETIKYFLCIVVFYAILATVLMIAGFFTHPVLGVPSDPLVEPLLVVAWGFVILVFTLIAAVIFGFWLHLWVYILGGREGVWQTEKSFFYGLTPMMLIGWIPVIGEIIGFIWSIVLCVIGVRELHKVSGSRAAIAVIVAVVLGGIILSLILLAFLLAIISSLPLV